MGVWTGSRREGACFRVALREGQGGEAGAEGERWAQRPGFTAASGGQRGTNGPFSREGGICSFSEDKNSHLISFKYFEATLFFQMKA